MCKTWYFPGRAGNYVVVVVVVATATATATTITTTTYLTDILLTQQAFVAPTYNLKPHHPE